MLRNKSKILQEIENSDLGADVKSVMSQLLQVGLNKGVNVKQGDDAGSSDAY